MIVTCPKCGKQGNLTLKRVKSYHYGFVSIFPTSTGPEVLSILLPADKRRAEELGHVVEREFYDPNIAPNEKTVEKRLKITYGPWTYPYVRHYDAEKYKRSMILYKTGKLKARPNGVRWCSIRTTPNKGESSSEFHKLVSGYDLTMEDLREDVKSNKFWMSFRREIKFREGFSSPHPIDKLITSFTKKKRRQTRVNA